LLASAHQDLAASVARGKFRADLYYRLSVFPIRMPALRQRVEDIPLLAIYFIQKYARRMNKNIDSVPDQALTALAGAEWPGNVGQLESLIEQAVIRCEGPVLDIPLAELEGGWAG
jgi:DNA-binding NtrC family response regulator